jgi:hypothetical protein
MARKSHHKDNSESCGFLANPPPNRAISANGREEGIFYTHLSKPAKQKSKGKDLKV